MDLLNVIIFFDTHAGKDVLVKAKTGTGKSAAFLVFLFYYEK